MGSWDFVFDLVPVSKPRQTQRDKWMKRPCVVRYREYADDIRRQARRAGFEFPRRGIEVEFALPMPASWSAKKKAAMDGQPHEQKPDLDNLIKAMKDALLEDDSVVSQYGAMEKVWGSAPGVRVRVPSAHVE